jgi:hypothetical protein
MSRTLVLRAALSSVTRPASGPPRGRTSMHDARMAASHTGAFRAFRKGAS